MAAAFDIPHTWEDPDGLHQLLESIRDQRSDANLKKIRFAYYLAEQAHAGQTRSSGEPYITHPLEVAQTLVELKMDDDSVVAALLHDVLEDCPSVSREKIEATFGEEVVSMVEGVTKLKFKAPDGATDRQRAAAETQRAAESLRKMLLAMAADVRVMVIKLADRLHNMRTLEALPEPKRIRIASETLDIYAPLAARLGIWQMKWQLEDLSFKYLHPREYEEIRTRVAKSRSIREEELRTAILMLKERLEKKGVRVVEVQGRPKHLYSIHNKIVKHGFKFEEILDLIALRVIVRDAGDCYVALGAVNELWVPIPQYFADYIARPKPNGYQSLHTKVIGPHGEPLEIQIRTQEMHEIAEMGVAAHYSYKEGGKAVDTRFASLRQQLFDWSSDYRTSSDFLRNLSTDLFSEQVFVFTPKGDVMDLPKDSTPVDFAFRVHTNLGLRLVGAKVNGILVPLATRLKNGDVVEVQTRTNAAPSVDWLEFVQSPSAKSKLRNYFRLRDRDDYVRRGQDLLERELRAMGYDPKEVLSKENLQKITPQVKDCETPEDVFAKVGEGLASVLSVINKLRGYVQKKPDGPALKESKEAAPMLIEDGLENLMMKRAKCCDPLPGEEVIGFVSRGRGIMIHRKVCSNATNLTQKNPERAIPMAWPPRGDEVFSVNLRIITVNRPGLLMDIATVLGESKVNVSKLSANTVPNAHAEIDLTVDVHDASRLATVMSKIAQFSDVFSILRVHGRATK